MVNPKKEYELLMRYLQHRPLKKEPAGVADHSFPDVWQATPQSTAGKSVIFPEIAAPLRNAPAPQETRTFNTVAKKQFPLFRPVRIFIAAVALLILFFFVWKGFQLYSLSAEKMFKESYIPFTISASSAAPAKNNIEHYYNTGNYTAVTLQSKKQPYLSDKEKLLTGLAFLHRDDYTKAIKWLEPASNNFKNPYRRHAEFYLALTYLKNEDYDRSIQELEQITYTPTHPYHSRVSNDMIHNIKMLKWK